MYVSKVAEKWFKNWLQADDCRGILKFLRMMDEEKETLFKSSLNSLKKLGA